MDPAVFNSDLSKVSIQLHYHSLIALVAYKKIASISKNKIRNIFLLTNCYDFLNLISILRYQKEICRTANSECSMPAHKLRFQYPVIFQNFLEPLF